MPKERRLPGNNNVSHQIQYNSKSNYPELSQVYRWRLPFSPRLASNTSCKFWGSSATRLSDRLFTNLAVLITPPGMRIHWNKLTELRKGIYFWLQSYRKNTNKKVEKKRYTERGPHMHNSGIYSCGVNAKHLSKSVYYQFREVHLSFRVQSFYWGVIT